MSKANLRNFDYIKVAKLDTEMWRSYNNGNTSPARLFIRAFKLIKYQLGFSWIATVRLAYYAGRAALCYRLKNHGDEDYAQSEKYLTGLFRTISRSCDKPFDFKEAAKLELEWWDIQRYPKKHTKSLSKSLNENMAAVYGLQHQAIKGYGKYRAEALLLLDKDKTKTDYIKMETLLLEAWKSLHDSVRN